MILGWGDKGLRKAIFLLCCLAVGEKDFSITNSKSLHLIIIIIFFSSDFGDYTNYTFVILLTKTKRKAHQIGSLKTNPGLYVDTTAHNSHCVWIYISCSTERSLPAEQNIHSV